MELYPGVVEHFGTVNSYFDNIVPTQNEVTMKRK
jgi:hypothetical protein